ncbi:MAG: hypothetical protein NT061_01940 [Spirochaetes bacterium]|nr:hypothetical protein [Spirochaetota bacterium]
MDESTLPTEDSTEEFSAEDQFLSPEDSRPLLAALENLDQRKLAQGSLADEVADEGSFISPGEEIVVPEPVPRGMDETRHSPDAAPVSQVLTRIAREVQSIKAELGALKSSQTAALSVQQVSPAPQTLQPSTQIPIPDVPAANFDIAVQDDIKRLLAYLDRLLESLPEDKVDEFARSEYFDLYRKVFEHFDLT